MEEQLLPRPELAPAYDKVVWLYLFRDFSGDEADRAAERACLRFGFTAYPQHYLVHPETLERLANTGRKVESFLDAVQRTKLKIGTTSSAVGRTAAAERRAAALEESGDPEAAARALGDADVVVRNRAVEILAKKGPETLVAGAAELLETPNDPLRYLCCEVFREHGDETTARALEATVREPKDSLNPNVLRIRAVQALGGCGDARSIAAIAPHARGTWNNGLTRISILALGEIAKRDESAREPAREALLAAYPEPPGDDEREQRAVLAIARTVHETLGGVTGKKVAFPEVYDAKARAELLTAW